MSNEIHVRGLQDLQKFLDTLPAKIERNVMRGALRAGAKVIEAQVKAQAPVGKGWGAGSLRDSIRVSTRTKRGTVFASVKAGGLARRGQVSDVYYANWVEFGTKAHFISVQESEKPINIRRSIRAGGIVRASMTTVNRNVLKIGNTFVGPTVHHPGAKPHPFMRPAMDSQAQAAVVAAAEYMKARLASKEGLDTSAVLIEGDE